VQYLLRQHGADVVVDGDYGPQTRAAVTAFNVANGIGKSALPGSQRVLLAATWEKLIVPVQQGSQGEAVRAVQSQLASRGMGVVVDGDFGPQTAQAVKTYQQQRGLAADGIVSAAMWSALVNLK
jgi:peptidoglycan hydrolase-like protein with peptidoglycan-binding domain